MTRPFRTSAAYYADFRPAYPPELIAQVAAAAELDDLSRVLDLGTGPGTIAAPLAAYAGEVLAIDVEPEMVAEARRRTPPNVTVIQGRAEDVDQSWGSFRLVTAGRSFHWFDAPLVLNRLVAVTPVVALFGDNLEDWAAQRLVLAIASELIDEPPIEWPTFRYADMLAASPFSAIDVISMDVERTWTPDTLIGLAYSTSAASPERLGERMPEFEARVRRELQPLYRERVGVDAVIGRRP
jgi:SAM-dependent methyltransferase